MPTDQLTWIGPRATTRQPATLEWEEQAAGGDDQQGDETRAHLLTFDALTTAACTAAAL